MTFLCTCFPCFSASAIDEGQTTLPVAVGEKCFESVRQNKPTYKYGVHWRIQEILHRQCNSSSEMHRLLNFVEEILGSTDSVVSKTNNSNFLTTILNALPPEAEARGNCRALIQILEQDGIIMSRVDFSKETPLLRAIKLGNRGALDALLHTQCDINATDRYSSTCLIYAVQHNDKETVQTILQQFPKAVNLDKADYANYTALAYAASNNNLELCKLLLQAGARTDVNSTSPFFLAVSNNASYELIQLLISCGASVNVSNSDGQHVLAAAVKNKQPEIVLLLLESGANYSKLWHRNLAFTTALNMDHLAILKIFVDRSVDISHIGPKGFTVIHEACCQGSVQFLHFATTETNIDLNLRNRQRRTAAHLAAQYGHGACLEILFQAGADCWSLDPQHQTTLEATLFHNRLDCVSFFIENPVFPRQKLFSVLHMLRNDYDPDALSRKPAVARFASLLQTKWGEGNQVETLENICIIAIRRFLSQRPVSRVLKLPLPEKVKDKVLSYRW